MNSDHSLLPAPRQEHLNGLREVRGVALTYGVSQGLRKYQIYILWVVFGATFFLSCLLQSLASWTLRLSIGESPEFITKLLQGSHLIYAFSPLLFGRLADAYSRPIASSFALFFFIVGCIVSAASPNSAAFAAGTVFHIIGMAGIGLLATLFIADYTPLKWRGIALSWTYLPYLVMIWLGPRLYVDVAWRWIYGMTAILVFALCVPAVYLLFSVARNYGATTPSPQPPTLKDTPSRLDLCGLFFFTLGFSLIEYSSTTMVIRWDESLGKYSPGRIVMLAIGLLLVFPAFIYWELCRASTPIMPRRILCSKGPSSAIAITFLVRFAEEFTSGALGYSIPFGWSVGFTGYFFSTSSIAYTASSPLLGVAYYVTRRSKPFLIIGNIIFIIGCALWLHAARHWDFTAISEDNASASEAYLLATQALIGLGTIAVEMSALIGSQASVTHGDLAITIALVFAWSRVAGTLGSSAAVAISLRPDSDRTKSIVSLGLALGLALLSLVISFFTPNFVLGDKRDAVEAEYRGEQSSRGAD